MTRKGERGRPFRGTTDTGPARATNPGANKRRILMKMLHVALTALALLLARKAFRWT